MKKYNLYLLSLVLLLSSCSHYKPVVVTIRYCFESVNDNTFLNESIYITNRNNSMSCTYFTKENKPIVSKDDEVVDYFDDEMKSSFLFKEGYSLDSKLKDNEIIVPSRLLLESREVTFKDGTIPANLFYSSAMTEKEYTEIFTRILDEDLQYSFYVDIKENESIRREEIKIDVVGIYYYHMWDFGYEHSLYRRPIKYNDYSLYATSIVSDTLFDQLKEYNSKGITREYVSPYEYYNG